MAGFATVGVVGVEMANEALAETQAAIEPLAGHLETLRWVFIAVALDRLTLSSWRCRVEPVP